MGHHQYYMLMASLPALPRFDQSERLPINRERLVSRQSLLTPEDHLLVMCAGKFMGWFPELGEGSNAEVIACYERLMRIVSRRKLWFLFELPVNLMTIMVALRRRHRGNGVPSEGEAWGMGPLVGHIRRHWDDYDFKLGSVYPWILQIRTYLKKEMPLELERFVLDLVWDRFSLPLPGGPFGIEALIAYLFKWSILQRWLSQDKEGARQRFGELVAEVSNGWDQYIERI